MLQRSVLNDRNTVHLSRIYDTQLPVIWFGKQSCKLFNFGWVNCSRKQWLTFWERKHWGCASGIWSPKEPDGKQSKSIPTWSGGKGPKWILWVLISCDCSTKIRRKMSLCLHVSPGEMCEHFWCQSTREESLISGSQNLYNDNGPDFYGTGKFHFFLDLFWGEGWLTWQTPDEFEDNLDWRGEMAFASWRQARS